MSTPSIYNCIKAILLATVVCAATSGRILAQTVYSITPVLSVYPDPATGNLNVKWENQPKSTADLAITDTLGNEVLKSTLNITTASDKIIVDLSILKEGQYRITINSEKISFTGKLSILPQ